MKLVVMKFGGTSVEDPAAIGRTAGIVAGRVASGKSPVVVVSAMAKVTDQLLRAADAASQGDRTGALAISSRLRSRHRDTAAELVKNKAGKFLKPIHSTIEAAVAASTKTTPATLAQSLIYASGKNSYPIINFEYLMVQKQQSSAAVAEAIRTFLAWASSPTGGATSDNLSAVDFVALPTSVIPKVDAAIAKITG